MVDGTLFVKQPKGKELVGVIFVFLKTILNNEHLLLIVLFTEHTVTILYFFFVVKVNKRD